MKMHKMTEDEVEEIKNKLWQMAEFEEGDWVTVEPKEHKMAVHGMEHEGVPMKIDDVTFNSHNVTYASEAGRKPDRTPRGEKVGDYRVTSVRYDLVPVNQFWDVRPTHLSEKSLIPWDEYDGVVSIEADLETDTRILTDREECPVCDCDTHVVSEKDNEVQTVGSENCAACDYQFGFWD